MFLAWKGVEGLEGVEVLGIGQGLKRRGNGARRDERRESRGRVWGADMMETREHARTLNVLKSLTVLRKTREILMFLAWKTVEGLEGVEVLGIGQGLKRRGHTAHAELRRENLGAEAGGRT